MPSLFSQLDRSEGSPRLWWNKPALISLEKSSISPPSPGPIRIQCAVYLSFGEQKGPSTGCWALSSTCAGHLLGKKKGRLGEVEPSTLDVMSILHLEILWLTGHSPVTQRLPSTSSPWLWVTFRVMLKFLYFPTPQLFQVVVWPPKKLLHLFLRIPKRDACHVPILSSVTCTHHPALFLLLQNPLSTLPIVAEGSHQGHMCVHT